MPLKLFLYLLLIFVFYVIALIDQCIKFLVFMYAFFRNSAGLPNLPRLIDGRARKFMDKLIENCDFTIVLNVFVCNLS